MIFLSVIRNGRVEIEPLSIVYPDSILAFGKISRLSANRYRIEVTQLVRGRIPPHGMVEFTAADQEWLGNHDHGTVLITDGRYDPRLGDFCRKMILNQANFPTGANKID